MSDPPVNLGRLSPEEKRLLLAKLLREKSGSGSGGNGSVHPPANGKPKRPGLFAAAQAAVDASSDGPGIAGRDLSLPELRKEIALDPSVVPEGPLSNGWTDPEHVLLTGATGLLGSHLVYELMRRTRATVHALVRADDPAQGRRRIRQALRQYELWDDDFDRRLVAVPGDLSRPRLGLSEAEFDGLSDRIDAVYHSGAYVNWLLRYSVLRAANIQGTVELLRLACRKRAKPFHHVSSMAVVHALDFLDSGVLPEVDELDPETPGHGGYIQTKWVSEMLVHAARRRGLPVTIHRAGMISGHSESGICNTDDIFCRTIKSCIQWKMAPGVDAQIDLTPVDYIAAAITHLSLRPGSLGHAFHLVNPQTLMWPELLAEVRAQGHPVHEVPYGIWQKFLISQANADARQNPLAMLAPVFAAAPSEAPENMPRVRFEFPRLTAGLAGSSIVCPPADAGLVARYIAYMVRSGFLGPPASTAGRRT